MTSKSKIFATCFIGVLLIAAVYVFAFQPLLTKVRVSNDLLSKRQQELDKIEKQILEFKAAQTDLSRATFKEEIFSAVVERENLSFVIEKLESAADLTNTTESIEIIEETPTSTIRGRTEEAPTTIFQGLALSEEVQYTLDVSNNYVGYVNFLKYLEHLPYFTEFKSITLNAYVDTSDFQSVNNGSVVGSMEGVFLVTKPKKNEEAPIR